MSIQIGDPYIKTSPKAVVSCCKESFPGRGSIIESTCSYFIMFQVHNLWHFGPQLTQPQCPDLEMSGYYTMHHDAKFKTKPYTGPLNALEFPSYRSNKLPCQREDLSAICFSPNPCLSGIPEFQINSNQE